MSMRSIATGVVLGLVATMAFGHARLTDTTPLEGGTIDADARAVTLHFSEPIQPRFSDFAVHYLGDDPEAAVDAGNRLARQEPILDGARRQADVPLPASAEPGWYALDWEVLADDGHTTGGTLRFQMAP